MSILSAVIGFLGAIYLCIVFLQISAGLMFAFVVFVRRILIILISFILLLTMFFCWLYEKIVGKTPARLLLEVKKIQQQIETIEKNWVRQS
jgi:hypothetical protein